MKKQLSLTHSEHFDTKIEQTLFMPGVIPFMGEHIEEAGGSALMIAIEQGLYIACSKREDTDIVLYDQTEDITETFDFKASFHMVKTMAYRTYIEALFAKLNKEKKEIEYGLNISIISDLPKTDNYGKKSALLLGLTCVLDQLFSWELTGEKIIKYTNFVFEETLDSIAHKAELMCMYYHKENSIMLINAKHNTVEALDYPFDAYHFLVFNPTRMHDEANQLCKKHKRYINDAFDFFQALRPITTLCDLELDFFNQQKHALNNQTTIRYAEHIFFEHARIFNTKDTIIDKDMDWFSEYINESEHALKNLFDVKSDDTTFLVETTIANGAIASRVINKGCHKMVLAIFDHMPSDKMISSYKERFDKIYKHPLYVTEIKPNKSPRKL